MVKNFEDMFIRFDRIHERDRHTDRQTDRHRMTAKTAIAQHRAAIKVFIIKRFKCLLIQKVENIFINQNFRIVLSIFMPAPG